MRKYRPNVAALILNSEGKLLICERMNNDGAWQFPQGGIDSGETALEALHREVWEEVGLSPDSYKVIEYRDGYRYDFPSEKQNKKGFDGQEQTYFLCKLRKKSSKPNIKCDAREFQNYKWIKKKKYRREWIPQFKQEVYEAVMWDFFGKELKE